MTTTDPATEAEPTTADAYAVAAEVKARIDMALAATSDAAQLAAEAAVLPPYITRTVLRALSHAHRHLADAETMSSPQAVGAALVVNMTTAEPGRRVICSCGLSFTPAAWELHRSGQDDAQQHELAGQLVGVGNANRRRAVDVLLGDDDTGRR